MNNVPDFHDRKSLRSLTLCSDFLVTLIFHMQSTMIRIAPQFIQQPVHAFFGIWQFAGQIGIDDGVYIAAFVQALAEQVREGGAGGESAVPGVAPDVVVDVQDFPGVIDLVSNQLLGCHRIFQNQFFYKSNLIALGSFWICQGAAAEAQGQDGTVDHGGGHLEVVAVGDGIVSLIDAFCQEPGNELGLHAV